MAALSHRPPTEADTLSQASKTDHNTYHNQDNHTPLSKQFATTPRSSISTSDRLQADLTAVPVSSHHQRHSSTPSTASFTKAQRSGSSLFTRAAAALDRTQNAIASISEPVLRPRQSNSALAARLSLQSISAPNSEPSSPARTAGSARTHSTSASLTSASRAEIKVVPPTAQANDPPSQPYHETDPSLPAPIRLTAADKKMHQTSSRLLRMTDDDRPFTRVRCLLTRFFMPYSASHSSLLTAFVDVSFCFIFPPSSGEGTWHNLQSYPLPYCIGETCILMSGKKQECDCCQIELASVRTMTRWKSLWSDHIRFSLLSGSFTHLSAH